MAKSFSKSDTKKKRIEERVKFTTTLSVSIRKKLENIAKNNNTSISNVIETMVKEYFA